MKKVLEGIERVSFETSPCVSMVGSLAATMHYLGDDVPNDWLMGVSGGAFFFYWLPPYAPSNCALHLIGEEPFRRTFKALGYRYDWVQDYDRKRVARTKDAYFQTIVRNIDEGKPALALGVVGPPEWCVVAGYDGDALLGWSFFQEEPDRYFRKEDWYEEFHGLVTVGERTAKPSQRETLRATLEWAIWLARTPSFEAEIDGRTALQRHVNGLAVYDAIIGSLLRDSDWETKDLEMPLIAISADGLALLQHKRDYASRFCARMACEVPEAEKELNEAAAAYRRESDLLMANMGHLVFHFQPKEEWQKMAERGRREALAEATREAKALDRTAVEHLEAAFRRI